MKQNNCDNQITLESEEDAVALSLFPIYRFLSLTADFMVQFAIPIVVYQITGSVEFSGFAFFFEWLPRIILVPLIGKYVDIFPNQKQFFSIDSIRISLLVLTGLTNSLITFILLLSLFSIINGYAYLVVERSVRSFSKGSRSGTNQAKLQAADSVAQVAGPAIAGGVLSFYNFNTVIDIGITLFVLGMLVIRKINFIKTTNITHTIGNEIRYVAIKILFQSKKLVRLTLLMMMINVVEGITLIVIPAVILDKYGGMPWGIGGLVGLATACSAVILYLLSYILNYIELKTLATFGGLLALVCSVILGFIDELIVFAMAFIGFFIGRTVFTVYMRTERMNIIPIEHLGKTIGVMISLILLPMPVVGVVAGLLGERLDPQAIILCSSVFASLTTLLVTFAYRDTPW